jgi:uncharacterized repeat protein (TIGR01451 family)/fimbrial isopeptide formation D2 family protein
MRKAIAAALVFALTGALLGLGADSAQAASTAPFTAQFNDNANGAIITIGNNLETCATGGAVCTQAKAGAAYDNNYFAMRMLDADSDSTTFNSSSSDLDLPAGSEVLFAQLHWGARLDGGQSGSNASSYAAANQIKFKVPGGAYQTLAGTLVAQNTSSYNAYQARYDVTELVKAAGNGTYWGANVQAGTGADRYAGWALTVVYTAPGMPLRNLTVYDGFNAVGAGYPQTITVSGFQAPHSGAVDVQLSTVTYEGDLAQTGDYSMLESTQLADSVSPGSNFFDSTNDLNGASVTTRNPADRNMFGFDIKNLGASGALPNGATTATFSFSSAGDMYYPGVLAMAINLYAPDFTPSGKTVSNITSGTAQTKPGDVLQYVLSWSNTGQDAAVNVAMSDPLPPNVTYVPGSLVLLSQPGQTTPVMLTDAAGDDLGEYDAASRTVKVNLGAGATAGAGGTMEIKDSAYVQFQVTADTAASGTTVTNTAHLAYTGRDTQVSAVYTPPPASITVATEADLKIEKSMAPSPATAGKAGTTTLKVTNLGPNKAVNVVVNDPLPSFYHATSVTVSNGASCATPAPPDPVNCNVGDLDAGASVSVTINGIPDANSTATSLSNIATVSSDTLDPVPANNVDSVSIPMGQAADVKISKQANPTSAPAGSEITYTITAVNDGPSDASGVVIADSVPNPNWLTLTSATPGAGVTCGALTSASVQCSAATLAAGGQATVTLKGFIPANVPAGQVANKANVSSATVDTDTSNNTATATVTVTSPVSDVGITKTAPASAVAGQPITYTVNVTNHGPSDATGIQVTDEVPQDVTATSAVTNRGSCSISGQTVTCTAPSLPGPINPGQDGGVMQITISGTIAADASGTVVNQAAVTTTSADADSGNNHASAPTTVQSKADLAVTKTGNADASVVPDPLGPLNDVEYTVTITNNGPSTALDATLADQLPQVLTFDSATPSAGSCDPPTAGAVLNCSFGDLAAGQSRTVVIQMHGTSPDAPANWTAEQLTETAVVHTTSDDPNSGNDTAVWTPTGTQAADLVLEKTSTGPFIAGGTASYTFKVTNNGPNTAAGKYVEDVLPAGLKRTGGDCSGVGSSGDPVHCAVGNLDKGDSQSFTIEVSIPSDLAAGQAIKNTANVMPQVDDPSPGNNNSTTTDYGTTQTDVAVTALSIGMCDPSDAGDAANCTGYDGPGSQRWVEFTVVNNGPSDAAEVEIRSDVALKSIIAADLPNWCHSVNEEMICELKNGPYPGGVLAAGDSIHIGFHFTIGSFNAPDQAFTACSPANYALGGRCADPGGWVEVATTTPDSVADNNGLTAPLTVGDPRTQLIIKKAALGTVDNPHESGTQHPSFVSGSTFTYQVQVSVGDAGSDAQFVVVTDTLPAGFTATSVSASQLASSESCAITGGGTGFTCPVGTVASQGPGETPDTITVTVSGTIASDYDDSCAAAGGTDAGSYCEQVPNTATATSPTPAVGTTSSDPATATSSPSKVDVIKQTDLQQFKLADTPVFYAGANVGYTLTTINNGPSAVDDAVVTDVLPAGVKPILADPADATDPELAAPPSASGCHVDSAATSARADSRTVIVCAVPELAAGASANIRVMASSDPRDLRPYWCPGQDNVEGVTCPAQQIPPSHPDGWDGTSRADATNEATVSTAATELNTSNNTASVTSTVKFLADVAVTSAVSTNTPAAGQDITYTLTGVNNGPSTADNPVVDADLPPGFIPLDSSGQPCADGDQLCMAIMVPTMTCAFTHDGPATPDPDTYDASVVYHLHCVGKPETPYRDSFLPGFVIPGTVSAHIPPDTPAGQYTSTNVTSTTTPESDYDNNRAPVTVTVSVVANTRIAKKLISPIPAVAGQPATYELTVTNDGPSVAKNVAVSDTIAPPATYRGAKVGDNACPSPLIDPQTGDAIVNCGLGDLDPGESATAQVTVITPKTATGQLCNSGLVGSDALDPSSENNQSQACGDLQTPPATDVGVEVTADPKTAESGDTASYTATVTNNGPHDTTNVQVTFDIPPGLSGYSGVVIASTGGADPVANCVVGSLICTIPNLPAGATVTYSITGTATGKAGAKLKLVGTVSHDDIDTNPANDKAAATVTLEGSGGGGGYGTGGKLASGPIAWTLLPALLGLLLGAVALSRRNKALSRGRRFAA